MALKDLKNTIRKEIFLEEPLDYAQMKFIEPGASTLEVLRLFNQVELKLAQAGVKSLSDMAKMNPVAISNSTGIEIPALEKLKRMALSELQIEEEAKLSAGRTTYV